MRKSRLTHVLPKMQYLELCMPFHLPFHGSRAPAVHALSPLSLGVVKLPDSCHYHVILSFTIPSLLPTVTEVNDVWLLKGITIFRMSCNPTSERGCLLVLSLADTFPTMIISNRCIKAYLWGKPIDNYQPIQMQREGNFWASFMSSNQAEAVRIISS